MARNLLCALFAVFVASIAFAGEGRLTAHGESSYFSAYRPNYIVLSTNGGANSTCDVKFQLSVKQRLASPLNVGDTVEHIEQKWRKRFYFGYTQRSFWDICRDSAPFRESVFEPELFHLTNFTIHSRAGMQLKRLQVGLRHESNGRDGDKSRSWNRAYGEIEYAVGYRLPDSLLGVESSNGFEEGKVQPLSVGLDAWYIIDTGDENRDIEDYLGYGRLHINAATKTERLSLTGWVGKKGKPSVQADLTVKALPWLNDIPGLGDLLPGPDNTYFWDLQYFNGYGDELVKYNRRDKVLRLGLQLTY